MKIIPTTKLRYFYESLAKLGFSTDTQLSIVKDINRKEKYKRLISLYTESKKHFAEYENIEESFLPKTLPKRKRVPKNVATISSTLDVISVFKERNCNIIVGNSDYSFKYIEREVPTYRTTNAMSVEGIKGKSGSGGIDFIGFNCKNSLPILGEIKVGSDQNTFYALIQLLTYLSELSTINQIKRINKYKLFENIHDLPYETSFYLYILLVFDQLGDKKEELLNGTQDLAGKLEQSNIQEIKKIVFLKMHPKTKEITKLHKS